MKPPEVIHFQRRPLPGQVSIERVFAAVRRALPAGFQCACHINPFPSRGVLRRILNAYHAARVPSPQPSPTGLASLSLRRSGWEREKRPRADIYHITGDVHYLALALDGQRTLLTIHDCVSLERLSGLKRAVFRRLWYDEPIRRAALVSVVSESTRRELLRHTRCDPSKVRTIYNCIGDEFVPCPRAFNAADPLLLQVGTGQTKNLERVIPAMAGLRCRLKIIGRLNREQLRLLETRAIRYSNLAHATDAELLQAYQECDLVLFASTYEGFGLPILEANATGRPVLTSNVLSMPEVAGTAACLVDPFDIAAIRAGLLKLLRDAAYRKSLVEAGFENARRFSAKRIAQQYAAVYHEMLKSTVHSPQSKSKAQSPPATRR